MLFKTVANTPNNKIEITFDLLVAEQGNVLFVLFPYGFVNYLLGREQFYYPLRFLSYSWHLQTSLVLHNVRRVVGISNTHSLHGLPSSRVWGPWVEPILYPCCTPTIISLLSLLWNASLGTTRKPPETVASQSKKVFVGGHIRGNLTSCDNRCK